MVNDKLKKTYKEPAMLNVILQHKSSLLTESLTDRRIGGNADFVNGGGMGGDTEARVKDYNIWDDFWDE